MPATVHHPPVIIPPPRPGTPGWIPPAAWMAAIRAAAAAERARRAGHAA